MWASEMGERRKAKGICCFLLLVMVNFFNASSLDETSRRLEISKYLSRVNKTPVMSIESDIIDYIPLYNQPAFDNPLLKNRTIQMRPSWYSDGLVIDDSKVSSAKSGGKSDTKPTIQSWHLYGRCPERTVPIRRAREEDVLRASSVERLGKKTPNSIPNTKQRL